jgi:glycosyltransferase involved in cell wall biosynthesis
MLISEASSNSGGRLRVLASAYACEPGKGSESGVGWYFSKALAGEHDVWILTRGCNRSAIEAELVRSPVPGLHVVYYDLPERLTRRDKDSRTHYFLWQLLAWFQAKKMHRAHRFDLCHHLTYNQYRTLSFGYFLPIPFVIGPVGGGELTPFSVYRDLEWRSRIKEVFRWIGLDRLLTISLCLFKRSGVLFIFSNEGTRHRFPASILSRSVVLAAIGISSDESNASDDSRASSGDVLRLVYAGRADDCKGIKIFLSAVAEAKKRVGKDDIHFEIKLIGIRSDVERAKVLCWVDTCSLRDDVEVVDFMPRNQLLQQMAQCTLCVYPAFRDSGSMSVLEACLMGCAVVCFDTPGQEVFPDDAVCKVPFAGSYAENISSFADKLVWAAGNQDELIRISKRAHACALEEFSWPEKAAKVSGFYRKLLEGRDG